jgi:DNA-binding transcriptional ArsR family regulator
MPLRPSLSHPPALRRLAALVLLAAFLLHRPAAAHEGHDHGARPEPVAAALPRAEAHSDLFEVVAILQPGGALIVTLDRYADNSPLDGAITLTLDGEEVAAERQGVGLGLAIAQRFAQASNGSRERGGSRAGGLLLMVLCMLIGLGEAGVGTLSAHARLSPAAMWRHLAKLRDDGVVATRRSGTEISSASPTGGWKRSSPPCGTSSA